MSFVSFHLSFIQPLAPVLLSSNIPGQPNTQKPSREVTRVLTLNGFTALGWCGPRAVEWPLDWSLHQRLGCKELHIHLSHMWAPYASSLYLHGTVLGHMVLLLRFAHIPITSVLGAYWVPGARCQGLWLLSPTRLSVQKGSILALLFCGLTVFHCFWTSNPIFSFAWGPTNYVVGLVGRCARCWGHRNGLEKFPGRGKKSLRIFQKVCGGV